MNLKSEYFDNYLRFQPESVMFSYYGEMNQGTITGLSFEVQHLFRKDVRLARKMFAVFMELTQNIRYYAARWKEHEQESPYGLVLIKEEDGGYVLEVGNVISESSYKNLRKKCDYINQLTQEELRKYRSELLDRPAEPESKGAGIGLVKVALASENTIGMDSQVLEANYAFFTVSVKFNK
jgi:Family of unknown function (DUF6272)